jgi:hypothetical protein
MRLRLRFLGSLVQAAPERDGLTIASSKPKSAGRRGRKAVATGRATARRTKRTRSFETGQAPEASKTGG